MSKAKQEAKEEVKDNPAVISHEQFNDFLERTKLLDAFTLIVAEISDKNVPNEKVFEYAANRLKGLNNELVAMQKSRDKRQNIDKKETKK